MPKIKTRRAAAKRFTATGSGEFKRNKAFKSHILEKKSPKRKRNLRKAAIITAADHKTCKQNASIRLINHLLLKFRRVNNAKSKKVA